MSPAALGIARSGATDDVDFLRLAVFGCHAASGAVARIYAAWRVVSTKLPPEAGGVHGRGRGERRGSGEGEMGDRHRFPPRERVCGSCRRLQQGLRLARSIAISLALPPSPLAWSFLAAHAFASVVESLLPSCFSRFVGRCPYNTVGGERLGS